MRKFLFFAICLILALSLAACGRSADTGENVSDAGNVDSVEKNTEKEHSAVEADLSYIGNVAYANWSEAPVIIDSCINGSFFVYSDLPRLPLFRITSVQELDLFRNTFENVLELHRGYGEIPSFDEQTSGCDESFFNDNDLLIAYVTASSGSFRFALDDLRAEDGVLRMYVVQTDFPEVFTDDMSGWFVIARIGKDCTEGFDSFDAVLKPAMAVIHTHPGMLEYGSFSYSETLAGLDKGSGNAKTEGFVNTDEAVDFLPVERAKAEAKPGYDLIQYFYDEDEDVWLVHFFSSDDFGNGTYVYLNGKGVTLLVIYED